MTKLAVSGHTITPSGVTLAVDTNSSTNGVQNSTTKALSITGTSKKINFKVDLSGYATKTDLANLPKAMVFKGTVGNGGTIASLQSVATSAQVGDTYLAIEDSKETEISYDDGDTIIKTSTGWEVIPSGDEPSGTVTNIATGAGLTGGPITTTGTISHATAGAVFSTQGSPNSRTYIKTISIDQFGHLVDVTTGTETVTDTNQKITVGNLDTNWGVNDTITFKNGTGIGFNVTGKEFTITNSAPGEYNQNAYSYIQYGEVNGTTKFGASGKTSTISILADSFTDNLLTITPYSSGSTLNNKSLNNDALVFKVTEKANTVHDANYKHITVSSTSVSDGLIHQLQLLRLLMIQD